MPELYKSDDAPNEPLGSSSRRAPAIAGHSSDPASPTVDSTDELESELAEKNALIQMISSQLVAREAQLARIRGTLAWKLLSAYGRLKHKYLLPFYRLVDAITASGTDRKTAAEPVTPEDASRLNALIERATKPYDVICLSIGEWDPCLFQRSQQLCSQYAQNGYRVFYVSARFQQDKDSAQVRRITTNVYEVGLPGPRYFNPATETPGARIRGDVLRSMEDLRSVAVINDAVCISESPFWTSAALALRERHAWKLIYNCMDDFRSFSSTGARVIRQEPLLISQSDLVLATSQILYERVSQSARRAILLPNAADFDHFSQPGPLSPLSHLKGPIVGYYGAISDWFDVEMVRAAAENRTDWQFVLIGDIDNHAVFKLRELKNVHLLGPQPYATLPSYLHQFDVACIPFLMSDLTRAVNPVKFYEYLSAGKPVVSVPLPDLEAFHDYFYSVQSRSDFERQVEAALAEDSPERRNARIEFARQNTWRDRFESLTKAVDEL